MHLQSADLSVNLHFAPFLHCSGATELLHLWQFLFDLGSLVLEDVRGGPKAICKKQS